jgi:PAS domain S-box-containing protein
MMQSYQHELGLIKDLLRKNPEGMSVTDLAKALGKNNHSMGRYLDILHISGQVDMRPYGMTKVYTLSRRVPLSAMLNYSRELIMVLDSDSRIVDINDHFLQWLRLSRQQVIGKNISFINPPDTDVCELLETISAGSAEQKHPITFDLKGGGKFLRLTSIPTVFEDGHKGRAVIVEDIPGHSIAGQKIRKVEEWLEIMAETISEGFVVAENEQVVFANWRISEITGYARNDLIGMGFTDLMTPEDYKRCRKKFRNTRSKSRISSQFTAGIKCRDGICRCILGKATVVWQDSVSISYVAITDITESAERAQVVRAGSRV